MHDEPSSAGSGPRAAATFEEILRARWTRRRVLGGMLAAAGMAATPRWLRAGAGPESRGGPAPYSFEPLPSEIQDGDRVAASHRAEVLIRWGDPVLEGARHFDPARITAAAQARQFGTNADFTAWMPLPRGSKSSVHGLLCVNHEYPDARLTWSGETKRGTRDPERVAVEMAASGHSVIELRLEEGGWRVVRDSPYARRVTARTPMRLSGPVRGSARVQTPEDPFGEHVTGTLNNCGGGVTPWGTVLLAEENFNDYFAGTAPADHPEAASHARYGIKGSPAYRWDLLDSRFDVSQEPREPNRFGWIVELDPYDPDSTPVKRTALGRFKHEAATVVLNADGRVVVYSGDDEAFEHLYKFVSSGRFDPARPGTGRHLLDEGTLYAARFEDDGGLRWLPLVFGTGPLVPENGFRDQADVLLEARRAATALGATPMDRPEDVEANPKTGRVYTMLTNNAGRTAERVDGANPRAANIHGHVLEIHPARAPESGTPPVLGAFPGDHAADAARWEVLLLAGEPGTGAERFSCPDNAAFDAQGRLWIATDQGDDQNLRGIPDGIYACDVDGEGRGTARLFFACPRGAEACGPTFTPDGTTLFVSVQHPGGGTLEKDGPQGSVDRPATRWPDFEDGVPPRSSVVAIRRVDGGPVGG